MNLIRDTYCEDGIFGTLKVNDETTLQTLERAYSCKPEGGSVSQTWAPKVPVGSYTCVRGSHSLSSGDPFDTFEVTGVTGHTGILFHPGNVDADSEGCILLGMIRNGNLSVLQSRLAFQEFMAALDGIDQFTLEVS
jgi:hypothetical protein